MRDYRFSVELNEEKKQAFVKENKYNMALVAHKNISGEAKNITHQSSICHIKDIDNLYDLLDDQSYYKGSGAWFDMNDRVGIYLGWYKEKIKEKLGEDYKVDIIELHKSYGKERFVELSNLEDKYENDFMVIGTEMI